jgi:hypothetical protein
MITQGVEFMDDRTAALELRPRMINHGALPGLMTLLLFETRDEGHALLQAKLEAQAMVQWARPRTAFLQRVHVEIAYDCRVIGNGAFVLKHTQKCIGHLRPGLAVHDYVPHFIAHIIEGDNLEAIPPMATDVLNVPPFLHVHRDSPACLDSGGPLRPGPSV